jgi:uncharacterized protein (TIGR01777 family)
MRILVSGASGLIGSALIDHLRAVGHEIVNLVRRQPVPGAGEYRWNPAAGVMPPDALDGVDAVVNLSGAGIGDQRWSESYRNELRTSRIGPTTLLAEAMAARSERPGVFVSASAVGWYGARGDEELTEDSTPGNGFLAELCRDWEGAADPARRAGVRVVHLRNGVVLSAKGGALRQQLPLFKLGLGGQFGSGRQWLSWISIVDEVAAIEWILESDLEGAVNVTSPLPVTNAAFTRALGRVLHRPALLRVPRIGPAMLLGGDLADTLLYTGQRVMPAALRASGFGFTWSEVEPALRAVLGG